MIDEKILRLEGRRILVTGASGDIGACVARSLSGLGAEVVLSGRDAARLEAAAEGLDGRRCGIEPFDLARLDEIPRWMKQVAEKHGPLYGLAHCAGVSSVMPIRVAKWEKAEEVMRVNWGASWSLAKGFRQKGVFAAGESKIVFISSTAGLVGEVAMSAYSASKGAVDAMTRSLAAEFAPDGIRVNSVAPGFIKTAMNARYLETISPDQLAALEKRHPLGFGATEDIASAIAFLLADTGRWITGITLAIDGGMTSIRT